MRNVKPIRILGLLLIIGNVASGAYFLAGKLDGGEEIKAKDPSIATVKKIHKKSKIDDYRKQVIRTTLALKNENIEMCYQDFLKTEPEKTQGAVKVSWTIDKSGNVSLISLISSDLKSAFLENCLFEQVKSTQFAPPDFADEVQVAHKFKFYSRSPANVNFE